MKEKVYRKNVAAVIVSSRYPKEVEVFIGLRSDIPNVWQFPQGGIDNDESPKEALARELHEEIGTDKIEVIAEYPEWEKYDFPEGASGHSKKLYNFDGQMQRYFLVRLKDDAKIDLHTHHPEFAEFRFVSYDELFNYISHFKKPIYKKVLTYFKKEGLI